MQKHSREPQTGKAAVGWIRALSILQLESLAIHMVGRAWM